MNQNLNQPISTIKKHINKVNFKVTESETEEVEKGFTNPIIDTVAYEILDPVTLKVNLTYVVVATQLLIVIPLDAVDEQVAEENIAVDV